MADLLSIFKLFGVQVAQPRVSSLAVLPELDVFKSILFSFFSGRVMLVVNQLLLESGKQAFDHRIIIAISFSTHGALRAWFT